MIITNWLQNLVSSDGRDAKKRRLLGREALEAMTRKELAKFVFEHQSGEYWKPIPGQLRDGSIDTAGVITRVLKEQEEDLWTEILRVQAGQ